MDLIIWILVVIVGVYIYKTFFEKTDIHHADNSPSAINNIEILDVKKNIDNLRFETKIPKGYQILFSMRDIVLSYNMNNAKRFLKGNDYILTLVKEPNNKHDSNAIVIMSKFGKIGYIPKEIAPVLQKDDLLEKIQIRIRYIWVGESEGKLDLQLVALKEIVKIYK